MDKQIVAKILASSRDETALFLNHVGLSSKNKQIEQANIVAKWIYKNCTWVAAEEIQRELNRLMK